MTELLRDVGVALGVGGGAYGFIRLIEEGVNRTFKGIAVQYREMRREPDSEEVMIPGQTSTNREDTLGGSR